jgi:hypothetical protein
VFAKWIRMVYLKHIIECKQIIRDDNGVISYPAEDGTVNLLSADDPVSMKYVGILSFLF